MAAAAAAAAEVLIVAMCDKAMRVASMVAEWLENGE